MRRSMWLMVTLGLVGAAGAAHGCILDYHDECLEDDSCGGPRAGAGPGGNAAGGTGGTGGETSGGGGSGGSEPCGGTCADPTPFCDPDTDTCVACLGSGDCTVASFPVCHEGACVACTPAEDSLCTGDTPYCDPMTLSCAPCRYHEHCPDSACNPFAGACLDAVPQSVGPSGADYTTLTDALASVSAGAEAVFVVAPTGGQPYVGMNVDNSRVIALLGNGSRPEVAGVGGNPTFQVAAGATLLLAGLDLRGNTVSRGLQADGLVALDQVEVASNNGGGINSGSTAELLIRNSIIAGNGATSTAIALGQGQLELVYSAVGGTFGSSAALSCNAGATLIVRNSILFNRNANPTLDCVGATISYTAADGVLSGTGNVDFGDPEQVPTLFANLDNGALRLTADGVTAFTAVALWQSGDPPTDIDGAPRPATDGTPDVCGADEGP